MTTTATTDVWCRANKTGVRYWPLRRARRAASTQQRDDTVRRRRPTTDGLSRCRRVARIAGGRCEYFGRNFFAKGELTLDNGYWSGDYFR